MPYDAVTVRFPGTEPHIESMATPVELVSENPLLSAKGGSASVPFEAYVALNPTDAPVTGYPCSLTVAVSASADPLAGCTGFAAEREIESKDVEDTGWVLPANEPEYDSLTPPFAHPAGVPGVAEKPQYTAER